MKCVSLNSCEKKEKKAHSDFNRLADIWILVNRTSFHESPLEARNRLDCGLLGLKHVPGVSGPWREEAEGVGSGWAESTQSRFLNSATDVTIEFWSRPLKVFKSPAEFNPMRLHLERTDGLDGSARPLSAPGFCNRIIFKVASL